MIKKIQSVVSVVATIWLLVLGIIMLLNAQKDPSQIIVGIIFILSGIMYGVSAAKEISRKTKNTKEG